MAAFLGLLTRAGFAVGPSIGDIPSRLPVFDVDFPWEAALCSWSRLW